MADIAARAQYWRERMDDDELRLQLQEMMRPGREEELADAFFCDLEFGTGGLRGVIGPGSNRMNIYTVGKATQGLADFLLSLPGAGKSVAIAHDPRINSELFARTAAEVLAANGIRAYLYPRLEPTPALSFAVRRLKASAGINITASHNPAEYNGYKAYGPDGCQITSEYAAGIQAAIDAIDPFDDVKSIAFEDALAAGMAQYLEDDVIDAFVDAVLQQSLEGAADANAPLKVVYTPLNGTGLECVTKMFERINVTDYVVVPQQEHPDGNFPTCPYPNPEFREALECGLELCKTERPDLLLATDPDADRVGIAVREEDGYVLPSGNEVGVLLFDYICRVRREQGSMPDEPLAVTTIVSSDMTDAIAAKYGVELRRCLTGFKYIGQIIGELESSGEQGRFIFGFEESYGYLSGTHVRDKDAINASMLICQMARYYREKGMSIAEAVAALYKEHGRFLNSTRNYQFPGAQGSADMAALLDALRSRPPAKVAGLEVTSVVDYLPGYNGLPKSNVMQFDLAGNNKLLVRPSGTEPKLKAYLFAYGANLEEAKAIEARLSEAADALCAGGGQS